MRAFLTIFGIMIGVLALVVMGSMSEKITLLVNGGIEYYGDKVIVADGSQMSAISSLAPMSTDLVSEIERIDGVKAAIPTLSMLLGEMPSVSMGTLPMIVASGPGTSDYDSFEYRASEGRLLNDDDRGKTVVGCDLVEKLDARVGGTVDLNGETFEVVGILDKTLTAPDNEAIVPLADLQPMSLKLLPTVIAQSTDVSTIATQITVYPQDGVNPNTLAEVINDQVVNVNATGPKAFEEQVVNSTKFLSAIIFGIALVSLLVGGLSVVNTMTMSVSERTREIGIRKAIGATNGQIMRQFIAESAVIGLIGGLLGLAVGAAITFALNAAGNSSGTELFLLTSRLAIGSVAFAFLLGILSGLYPAWHAARLNPVQALRFE